MKIHVRFKHRWPFRLFVLCLLFIISLPFTFIAMVLVSGSPFWMWQMIFMFFAALLIVKKD